MHILTGSVFLLAVAFQNAMGMAAQEASPEPPANLLCEYRPNPLGIDVIAPRLSWQVQDPRRGAVQTGYQVLVSTDASFKDARALAWDTGQVKSGQSIHVVYAGQTLVSRRRYFWKVRTWDAQGRPSAYSQPASWEMGLLQLTDWQARWITRSMDDLRRSQPDLAGARWIWCARAEGENKSAWFRRVLQIEPGDAIERAEVLATADNVFTMYVNGAESRSNDNFMVVQRFEITERLRPGGNLIAVKCHNTDGAAGLLVSIRVTLASGKTIDLTTDERWKCSDVERPDWLQANTDESAWEPAKVVGTYGDAPWGPVKAKAAPRRSACFRREFTVKSSPTRARVYVTGLGAYKLQINGQAVSNDILSPGWTDYRFRVQYQTYDVTALLKAGPNAIGAMIGNAWWSGGIGWSPADFYSAGNLRLLLQLVVEYADGSQDIIVTDKDWRTHLSPVTRDSLYNGETYDARLEASGWTSAGFAGEGWTEALEVPAAETKAVLVADRCEPIQVTQELPAVWLSEPESGVWIYDFGQNAAGCVRLKVRGPAGTKVRLRFGEELDPGGRLYRENYRSAESTDYYICKGTGAEEVWEPAFTYHGFRYCEVTGYPGTPARDALTFRVFHNALPTTGVFECSQPTLNQIYRAVAWGQRSNLHSIPTDCPQRDERLGWTGDANVFGATSCWNMQMGGFYGKWMRDLMDSQSPEGWVTDVAPAMIGAGPAAPGWGDACITTPMNVYRFYGDKRILEENYDGMVRWIEYMHAKREPASGLYEREGFGDWVAMVDSPKKPIAAAYHCYCTSLVAETAEAIGRKEDAEKYRKRADDLNNRFNKAFFDPQTNQYPGGTQTANLLPLAFGITPMDRRAAVTQNVVNDIKQRGYHLSTGFLGTVCLLPMLSDGRHYETAYKLGTQTTCPSWGYMFSKGATTIWERWDTDKWGPSMNSRNHYAFGAAGEWLFQSVAGISFLEPGFRSFSIFPGPVGDLQWARASYASMYGDIRCEWHRTADGLTLDVQIPANTKADVALPKLGFEKVTISESGKRIVVKNKAAGTSDGVSHVGDWGPGVAFKVGAGSYHFEMKGQ